MTPVWFAKLDFLVKFRSQGRSDTSGAATIVDVSHPSDEQLYAAWTAGDVSAGRTLIARRMTSCRRFARSLLPLAEAEDAVQEVFERLTRRAREGGEVRNVRAFVLALSRNVVRESLRRRAKGEVDLGERSFADLHPDQSELMLQQEKQHLLLKSLHRLPVDDQILLSMRYWEQLRSRELAQILDTNHNTVRTRLRRAEARLEKIIHELADSEEAAQSTFGSLTGWAKDMREHQS